MASGVAAGSQAVTLFTVPDGYTYLVKSIYGQNVGSAGGATDVIANAAAGSGVTIALVASTAGQTYRWDGWLALDPGARLTFNNWGPAATSYYVSGTKLPGAAPGTATGKPA
jgi:hypothetical protein